MADPLTSAALVKRRADEIALMPPPPLKRIKRPTKVLDEDEYTSALSHIIARDYFPGLLESQVQQEYFDALDSNNPTWIAEAGSKLREVMTPMPAGQRRRSARNTRFDTPRSTERHLGIATPAADTPRGWTGSETPTSLAGSDVSKSTTGKPAVDMDILSLSAFQAKYTSEDNESFNALLDKQNANRRGRASHMWTLDQRIPSARLIAYRERESRLLAEISKDESSTGKELVPITTGAIGSRPAKPDSWKISKPDNTFMFPASSVDEDTSLETIAESKQAASKAPPKAVVYANTRFAPQPLVDGDEYDDSHIPASPSLNTTIIAERDARRAARADSSASSTYAGGDTPRVNGYAFVDEEEPAQAAARRRRRRRQSSPTSPQPSYRDLLAGHVPAGDGDGAPNPFQLKEMRKREDLHHRLVERENRRKRAKEVDDVATLSGRYDSPAGAVGGRSSGGGGAKTPAMTPAAWKLLEKLGRTPVSGAGGGSGAAGRGERILAKDMWTSTPVRTPRRKAK